MTFWRDVLCWIGFHSWKTTKPDSIYKGCTHCGHRDFNV